MLRTWIALAGAGALAAACTTTGNVERNAAGGAAIGALAGAVIGNNVGAHNPASGALIGAAAGGLLGAATGFSIHATAPAYGATDLPVEGLMLSLATAYLASRSLDQVDFMVSFPPGLLKSGPFTIDISLTANGQTASSSATLVVGG